MRMKKALILSLVFAFVHYRGKKGCYQISIEIILADLLLFLIGQFNKLNQWIMSVPITAESMAKIWPVKLIQTASDHSEAVVLLVSVRCLWLFPIVLCGVCLFHDLMCRTRKVS